MPRSQIFPWQISFEIARALCREFRKGTSDMWSFVTQKFVSMLSQMPVSVPILPLIDIAKEDGEDPEAKKNPESDPV